MTDASNSAPRKPRKPRTTTVPPPPALPRPLVDLQAEIEEPQEPLLDRIPRGREMAGVLVSAFGVLLALALLSYQPATATDTATNLVGPAGVLFADIMYWTFGAGSFFFVVLTGAWAVGLLRSREVFGRWEEATGYLLSLLTGVTLLELLFPSAHLYGHEIGGWLGEAFALLAAAVVGRVGATVCALSLLVVAFIFITESSVVALAEAAVEHAKVAWERARTWWNESAAARANGRSLVADGPSLRTFLPGRLTGSTRSEPWHLGDTEPPNEAPVLDMEVDTEPPPAQQQRKTSVLVDPPSRSSLRTFAVGVTQRLKSLIARQRTESARDGEEGGEFEFDLDPDVDSSSWADGWKVDPSDPDEEPLTFSSLPIVEAGPKPEPPRRSTSDSARRTAAAVSAPTAAATSSDDDDLDRLDTLLRIPAVNPADLPPIDGWDIDASEDEDPTDEGRLASLRARWTRPVETVKPSRAATTSVRASERSTASQPETSTMEVRPDDIVSSQRLATDSHRVASFAAVQPAATAAPVAPVPVPSATMSTALTPSEPVIVESEAQKMRKRASDLERVVLPNAGNDGQWQFPPLSFLRYEESDGSHIDHDRLKFLAARLTEVLASFKVFGSVTGICPGPVVTRFEFQPESGTKISKISGLSDDIAMALKAFKVRIIAPIPGKGCVGIEVPNDKRENVYLKEILADDRFISSRSRLTVALGKDIEGFPVVADFARMPHLLIAGTTGSGKSVTVNAMITSILYNASPDDVRLILVDPKQLEFAIYQGVPHLLLPVVTDPAKANTALQWAVTEMERRYSLMSDMKVRNLDGYNQRLDELQDNFEETIMDRSKRDPLCSLLDLQDPDGKATHRRMFYILIIVDEFADLMMTSGKEVEVAVARLAAKARAAGIHLMLATQRPSVDVLTGVIKANFPTRMSCRLMSGTDSRTVLDSIGAENLLGMGDMLYRPNGSQDFVRVHGAYVDEREIEKVVDFLKAQRAPEYDESILKPQTDDGSALDDEPIDDLYDEAVQAVIDAGFASISMVQRKFRIGYNRSARMVERMEKEGIVGPASGGSGRREVLVGQLFKG